MAEVLQSWLSAIKSYDAHNSKNQEQEEEKEEKNMMTRNVCRCMSSSSDSK